MHIRVLYFEGCPHSEETIELVRRIVGVKRLETAIETIEVRSREEAIRLRFLGSPTVLINGVDIDPEARNRTDFAIVCRLYGTGGVPTADMIVAAVEEAVE